MEIYIMTMVRTIMGRGQERWPQNWFVHFFLRSVSKFLKFLPKWEYGGNIMKNVGNNWLNGGSEQKIINDCY
jgi:hypothetical protein